MQPSMIAPAQRNIVSRVAPILISVPLIRLPWGTKGYGRQRPRAHQGFAGACRGLPAHRLSSRRAFSLEVLVVDEANLIETPSLQVRQGLGHHFVVRELIDADVHLGLRRFLSFGADIALESGAVDRRVV